MAKRYLFPVVVVNTARGDLARARSCSVCFIPRRPGRAFSAISLALCRFVSQHERRRRRMQRRMRRTSRKTKRQSERERDNHPATTPRQLVARPVNFFAYRGNGSTFDGVSFPG
jgi:hypothetical protein